MEFNSTFMGLNIQPQFQEKAKISLPYAVVKGIPVHAWTGP